MGVAKFKSTGVAPGHIAEREKSAEARSSMRPRIGFGHAGGQVQIRRSIGAACEQLGPNPWAERRAGTGEEGGWGWSEIHTYEVKLSADLADGEASPGALSSSFPLPRPRNGCA